MHVSFECKGNNTKQQKTTKSNRKIIVQNTEIRGGTYISTWIIEYY
jgi:hypothetical protein